MDVFDTISDEKSTGDVFDKVASGGGDIFDRVSPAYAPRSQPRPYTSDESMASGIGNTPYDKFKLQESRSANLPDYPVTVPPSLNPNFDFARETQGGLPGIMAAAGRAVLKPVGEVTAAGLTTLNRATAGNNPNADLSEVKPNEPLGGALPLSAPENQGIIPSLSRAVDALRTPENIGALALSPVAPELISGAFASQIPAGVQDATQRLLNPNATEEQRRGALTDLALLELMRRGTAPKESPKPQLQGPPATGESLQMPRGAVPEQTVEDPMADVSSIPSQGPTFQGIKDNQIPKPTKVEVPETAPEAERSINVSEEIRSNGARTIADIQRLFPQAQLTREAARTLRNAAWGEPDVNGVLPEQPNKPATPLPAAQPAKPSPVSPTKESIAQTEPQEPPSQPATPNINVTATITQSGKLPIEAGAKPAPVKFLGIQKGAKGIPDAEYYNLTEDIPGHSKGSTLSRGDLEREGYIIPKQSQPVVSTKAPEGGSEVESTPSAVSASETAPTVKPEATDSGYGIAERVRTEREKAGTGPETQPGEVPNAEESVENGRKMIQDGVDPESALKRFEQTGQSRATDIALVRAQGEKLAKAASDAAESKGIESPEYKAARNASFAWEKRTKKLQTDWAERGQAQQGHTDLDTGNFHELARAHYEATGKEFTPEQAKAANKLSKSVKAATTAAEAAKKRVLDAIKEPESTPAEKGLADKVASALEKAANDAYARIRQRISEGRLSSGLDPTDLADHAIYGAAKIAKGALDFGKWSADMVKDLGEYVKPHLKQIWDAANDEYKKRTVAPAGTKKELSTQQQVWKRAKELLNNGENDFDDIRHKIATEMGLPVKDVTKLLSDNQGVKRMSDEMYRHMAESRRLKQQAKSWLKNQQTPGWIKFTKEVPRAFFAAKVFGHGTVGMITHAGLNVFNPLAWKTYWPEFFRQFPMAVKTPFHDAKAFHEQAMQDLIRDPNYITARRAGLANDPFKYSDDYQNPGLKNFIEKLDRVNPISGSRGFDALKTFRQARFNQIWNALPEAQKTPNVAKVIADAVNHSSGVVKTQLPEWMQNAANVSLFAPKLEMSRWAWLVQDPAKAAITFTGWKNATPEARVQAIGQLKEKATIAAVYASLLAANQGLLKASGSTQNVNTTDPTKSDFLSFKVAGHKIGVVGPMIGMVKLFAELAHTAMGKRSPAEKRDSRYSEAIGVIGSYARGKASPFASVAIDTAAQADFRGQPLPFSKDKVPAYLRKEGLGRYTWPKYATDKLAPIPAEESIREVWSDMGLNESQQSTYLHAIIAGFVAGGTGIRYSKDFAKPTTGAR